MHWWLLLILRTLNTGSYTWIFIFCKLSFSLAYKPIGISNIIYITTNTQCENDAPVSKSLIIYNSCHHWFNYSTNKTQNHNSGQWYVFMQAIFPLLTSLFYYWVQTYVLFLFPIKFPFSILCSYSKFIVLHRSFRVLRTSLNLSITLGRLFFLSRLKKKQRPDNLSHSYLISIDCK